MPSFTGQLRSNEIFGALFNMIISQQVFSDNIKGTDLVDSARVDGGLYGDTKLYYSTDALSSAEWGNDAEAANLLDISRPDAPECQAIVLDKFFIISLTVDNYLSKRAWSTEGAFSQFNSVMLSWLRDTKKVKDGTEYNCFIGTCTGAANVHELEVDATDAKSIAEGLANLVSDMTDYTRDFNDYQHLRRYAEEEIEIIFNSRYVNKITNVDLPVIFNNQGLKATFARKTLNHRYFGTVNAGVKVADAYTRSLIEQTIGNVHYFAGDKIALNASAPAGTSYQEDADVIAKVYVKLPPFMSAFETGTSFFNARSLTENHYLIYGRNTLEYLKAFPMITVKAAQQ